MQEEIVLTQREKYLFNRLVSLAKMNKLTSYSEEAARLNPPILARHPSYCKMLDRINTYSYQKYGLFLAAIVKHKSSDTVGMGFFVAVCNCTNLKKPLDKMDLKQNLSYYNNFWKQSIKDLFDNIDKIELEDLSG